MKNNITSIVLKSINHIELMDYKSFDLFDALTCHWINKISNKSNLLRRIIIQTNAKSPINLHWLGMSKRVHTKLISDLLLIYSLTHSIDKAKHIYKIILDQKCKVSNTAWGLNFPYTSRFINAEDNTPNIYNTTTVGIAICEIYKLDKSGKEEYINQLQSIVNSLFQVFSFNDESNKGWFSYYPGQTSPTYNVNALAAYFLCKVNYSTKTLFAPVDTINKLINLLIEEQNPDGSWYYSRSGKGKWIDGFHTGFIIESLAYVYSHGYTSAELNKTLIRAWNYYIQNLFTVDGTPKYFNTSSKYPIESQNCAQAIQTLSLVGLWLGWHQRDLLENVINNTVYNLYNVKGYFYYKKTKYYTYKQSYLRWSTSPMLVALTYAHNYFNVNRIKQV